MTPNSPDDLAVIAWDKMAGLLRTHGVHEDEIFKSGKSFKAGFEEGFAAGYKHCDDEEEEAPDCVGFEHTPIEEEEE